MSEFFSQESLAYIDALPGTSELEVSTKLGWRSLLTTHSRAEDCPDFETVPTPDQTLILITAGHGEVTFFEKGRWTTSPLDVGSINLIAGNEVRRVGWRARGDSPPLKPLHIFLPARIVAEASEHFRKPGLHAPMQSLSAMAVRNGSAARMASTLLMAMRKGVPDIYAEATAKWLAVHLLASRSGCDDPEDERRPGSIGDGRLTRALDFIRYHLGDELNLTAIAAEAGVSKFHFIKLFHEKTGETPIQYLYRQRLDWGAQLLITTDLAVKQVAFTCGFKNISHFNESFQRRFGASPTTYRRDGKSTW